MNFRVMVWKESAELWRRGGQIRLSIILQAIIALGAGIVPPIVAALVFAPEIGTTAAAIMAASTALGFFMFLALLSPITTAMDMIAGERERHTLETLLTFPVDRSTLLWSKATVAALPGMANTAVASVAFLATASATLGLPGLLTGLVLVPVALLGAALATAAFLGVALMISAKAPTVKDGQQRLGYAMFPVFLLPGLSGPVIGAGAALPTAAWVTIAVTVPAVLIALAITSWAVAWRRLARDRLMAV